ncbi:DUF6328 family protein [Actinopolymorpha pittospori]|uniref:Uncharacterized protein n=1 Tax=Actinopolymorpha pittospori TaxID=648752 RepID=A0A927MP38_9ACTN|nr:DUF6328 family protein [Actinopolymorpha pittospori]MBE1603464.1 hypothetical protein [Actinopolymorpha pittospori]
MEFPAVSGGEEHGPARPGESPVQRADRNFAELIAELRVLQTGVQFLFGFLLILAVQARFADPTTLWPCDLWVTDLGPGWSLKDASTGTLIAR